MDKKTVAVLFGGQSSEHIVSCMSAVNVIEQIDEERYHILLIGITQEGHWLKVDSLEQIISDIWRSGKQGAVLSPDATEKVVLILDGTKVQKVKVDVVFPVLHGLYGEDGTIQGLLEMAQIPYVGCGVLSSAISMDKLYTKMIVGPLGIRQADYIAVYKNDLPEIARIVSQIEDKFDYPVFIKPANAGSSQGVSKAEDTAMLINGIQDAWNHDDKVLVEEMIVGREIECAVLGGGDTIEASDVGEILAAAEFYDFEAKYFNEESKTLINPDLPGDSAEQVRGAAKAIFKAVNGYGLARVDFFVKEDGTFVFNEINTMPGFTAISMYPMLWQAKGIGKSDLVNRLLELAFLRSKL